MNYYISDLHLGHKNLITHCNRPFKTAEEMDETIITNWNNRIGQGDVVYILGDFAFRNKVTAASYLIRLNGKKHLVIGNHDAHSLKEPEFISGLESVDKIKTIHDGNYKIVLCHYPILEWDGYNQGWLHFHGHIHNRKEGAYYHLKSEPAAFNVGADVLGFVPMSLHEVVATNAAYYGREPLELE